MKTRQELTEILDFIAEYATYLLGSGVHTSRVIRNSQRIGASQGVDLQLSSFQKSTIITAHDEESGEAITRVVKIPALPISFERNSDLSALSWDALDERLPLSEIRRRYDELTAKPRMPFSRSFTVFLISDGVRKRLINAMLMGKSFILCTKVL